MGAFHRAGQERVNAFPVGERVLFKEYFDDRDLFARLSRYYDNQHYRFAVPSEDLDAVRSLLGDHGYALVIVDAIAPFVVVVRQYTTHPENIFRDSVAHRRADDYNCFLMTDRDAVDRAVDAGATELGDVDIENPF